MKLEHILKPKSKIEIDKALKKLHPTKKLGLLSKLEIEKYLNSEPHWRTIEQNIFEAKIYDIIKKLNKDSLSVDICQSTKLFYIYFGLSNYMPTREHYDLILNRKKSVRRNIKT